MAIEWLSKRDLEERLKRDYPVPGLWLRSFLDGRLPRGIDPRVALGRDPEIDDWAPGLGVTDGWVGLADGVPFVLAGKPLEGLQCWGFNLALPVRVHADHRLDVSWLLEAAASVLPPALRPIDKAYVEPLPFEGPGWGVPEIGGEWPLFRSPVREDAVEVARFIDGGAAPDRHRVISVEPTADRVWIVAGPRFGRLISRLEVLSSREQAELLASRWSTELGVPFTVHQGKLDGPA